MECHTTLERVVAQRANEKFIKDSDFNLSVVNNEKFMFGGYCNLFWRIGHKEAQCWFKQEYMKSNPSQDPSQRDMREWSNTSEKGQSHNQPKGKSKGKGKGPTPCARPSALHQETPSSVSASQTPFLMCVRAARAIRSQPNRTEKHECMQSR